MKITQSVIRRDLRSEARRSSILCRLLSGSGFAIVFILCDLSAEHEGNAIGYIAEAVAEIFEEVVHAAQLSGITGSGEFDFAEVFLEVAQVGFSLRPLGGKGEHGVVSVVERLLLFFCVLQFHGELQVVLGR